jgi:shikimate dehydrogenase
MAEASRTTLCGSLSRHPVSLGATMHRAGYAALGLDYAYVPFAVDDLEGALRGMRALGIRGFGVSMPFKLEVIPLLDRLDELAERIGAVNTIVNDDGVLSGYNTDAWGAARALEEALPIAGATIALIGAGGAARAVAYALVSGGARLSILNRTPERARQLATDLAAAFPDHATNLEVAGVETLATLQTLDGIVNASSVGMVGCGQDSPVPESALRPGLVVMDIVYAPIRTALLEQAERAGAVTVHGGRMLLHQACRQFELYTGRSAPHEVMDRALRAALGEPGG